MLKAEMFNLNGGEFIDLGESSIANERYIIRFPSNYGIDICSGELYHCDENTYETAIVTFDDDDIFYLAGNTKDNIFDYQTIENIQELINKVSEMSSQTLLN